MQATSEPSGACFDSLAAHFGELGISGQGLESAAQGSPLIGPLIGAYTAQKLYNLSMQRALHILLSTPFNCLAKTGGMQK